MKKKGKKIKKKDESAEDWCFVCKDGGLLIVCDYKQCLKSYHAECVGKDESALETENSWTCASTQIAFDFSISEWHSCLVCHKSSKFQCFCCPNAVCQRCSAAAEFARVRGNRGFCNNCLKLALLSEENMDVDSDGEKVDFKDRETVEGLFKEYWDIIKEKEGLTVEHLHSADIRMKKGKNYKYNSYKQKSDEDEESRLSSDSDDDDDDDEEEEEEEEEGEEEDDGIEGDKPVQKKRRSKGRRFKRKSEAQSNKREFIGWGSKTLIDFLSSIDKDTSKKLSQYDVSSIITGYINENRLFDPHCKRKILCDEKLKSVLGRKTVNRHKIYDILEPHFIENLEVSEEEQGYSSEDEDRNLSVAFKKQKKSSMHKKPEKKEVFDAPMSYHAAIIPENIKLLYLRRSLVQELLKQPETFECKVIGSFVRVKPESSDDSQSCSHLLVQVTGVKKTSSGENSPGILLEVSNISTDIRIDMLSDDNFSEEECNDLKQKVKGGLLRKPTIVEVEQKARNLHKDITKHWIGRELALLQNRIDRANEKGWRREYPFCSERKQQLETESEQFRLLERVPKVIADVAGMENIFEDAIKEYKQGNERSPKSTLMGSSETRGDTEGASGISSGDSAVAIGNSSDVNGNAQATIA
ncbi:hypothetical protein RHSIM_Rhsim12G0008900 [Rhododendron simsii]|uniref:Uncharacterized protein n=1 Tax=Rhododendron simsii TaxID=118357 RepID=A0A834G875_RHOSS|nr:hypothetical protein RHSIM_Rhsim12G0008900 [Rhododendron simsii]